MKKLEIGSGNRPLEGYEHLDINPDLPHVDIVASMDKIPVEDNTYDEVNSVHVIEHWPWRKTLDTLKEWVRILKPGGVVRMATPNLRWIAQSYLDAKNGNDTEFSQDAAKMTSEEREHLTVGGKLNPTLWANFKIMSSGGQWDEHFACFDADLLCALLVEAGCSKTQVDHDGDSLVVRGWK